MTKAFEMGKFRDVTLAAMPWDMGARSGRQDQGKVIEPVVHRDAETGKWVNPNGVVRSRRERWVDRYARKCLLGAGHYAIACELIDAAAGMVGQDPLSRLNVDRTYGDCDPMVGYVDRRAKFRRMWSLVPVSSKPVMDHVLMQDRSLRSMAGCVNGQTEARYLERLVVGLDALIECWSVSKHQTS